MNCLDWLAELEQRFQLGQVEADRAKITWCQLLIGATGSSILASLEDGATWEAAKETLLSRLEAGSVRDEAWASLKQLKRGLKEIIELAGEAEKLAKRLHPRDEEAAERHAVDAFLDALDRPLAAEVQKLGGRTMEEVVSAARRIERILHEHFMESMQSQIQILTKDLAKAHERIAAQPPAATPTAAFAAPPSNAVAAAQHTPASLGPPQLSHPTATPLPPMATAQPPPYHLGQPQYFDFGEEPPYFRGQRRQSDRRPLRCFLCDEEGHFAYCCPARTLLQHLLRQQAHEQARRPPRGQVLELPAADGNPGSSAVHLN